eukprot:TRINITY_DN10093_c0_g1_i1.p1 TRINITY_DN10093_c0_g1~~TRINITY_DN10093_c0_g1_i1.p1  ORF type:complete len:151 (+),score=28.21 TRINITY_DN10093_c0_g1_i1:166-618(+)
MLLISYVHAQCGLAVNGTSVDLSPLSSQTYRALGRINSTEYTFEIQVCGNAQSKYPACRAPSPINQVSDIQRKIHCANLGELGTESWDFAPSGNGVYLTYYHGLRWNNVIHRSARIYFECNNTEIGTPVFEHVTDCGQFHFSWTTKYACF